MKGFNTFTKLLALSFDFRLFVLLAIGFIAFTVIGTVSHESGHYLMAKCFGYEANILTGTIGLIILILLRKRYFSAERLSFGLWLLIFITLFWLRQTANFFIVLPMSIIHGSINGHGDEFGLARYFHLPVWSILTFSTLIGIVILAVVIFKFIPIKQRLTFMAAGLVGGVTGFVFWLILFGKIIMP